ncbi:MAG: hypothetical protein Q4C96_07005 [Planctomycetia bacterium]|nr:hypothetical protein [Planctomycetia bacterium]
MTSKHYPPFSIYPVQKFSSFMLKKLSFFLTGGILFITLFPGSDSFFFIKYFPSHFQAFGQELEEEEDFSDFEEEDFEDESFPDEEIPEDDFENEETVQAPPAERRASSQESSLPDDLSTYLTSEVRQFGDAGVEAILATEPETAQELVRAGKLIDGLGRTEIAEVLFRKALACKPTDNEIYDMVIEHGQSYFAALSKDPRYSQNGKKLGETVLEAMRRRFEDESIIKSLYAPDREKRRQAASELQTHDSLALPLLILSLADEEMKEGRAEIETFLLTFGESATSAVGAVLESDHTKLKTACVRFLSMQSAQGNQQALHYLFLAAAHCAKEEKTLQKEAYRALSGIQGRNMTDEKTAAKIVEDVITSELLRLSQNLARIRGEKRTDTTVTVIWRWNDETKRPRCSVGTTETELATKCYRFARALWKMNPESAFAKREYLRNTLEQLILQNGFSSEKLLKSPEYENIRKAFSPEELESVLVFCLNEKAFLAATGAVIMLGEMGNADMLIPREFRNSKKENASPLTFSPLVMAINTPDRHLRFAAMETIMKWDPQKSYSGSHLLIENLAWFLSSSGKQRILVCGNNLTDAASLGGSFMAEGYHFDTANSGKEMLVKCQNCCDYAFLLICMDTRNPSPDFLAQSIRQDIKMGDIPIVFIAESADFHAAERLADKTFRSVWFPYPQNDSGVELITALVHRLNGFTPASDLQRLEETRKCLIWAEKIVCTHRRGKIRKIFTSKMNETDASPSEAENSPSLPPICEIYDISKLHTPILNLMSIPAYTSEAAKTLAWFGTPLSQQTLISFASSGTKNMDLRKKCVLALQTSVDHYGVLISGTEVAKQYDLYNETPEQDSESRIIRNAILTVLERPLMKSSDTSSTPL